MHNAIIDVPGIRVGNAQDETALTGCTVVLCEAGAMGGVSQAGGAPGTRETDALHPMHLVQHVHAVVLTGGSAFGLDSAGGVVGYLEAKGVGFDVGVAKVPIVPAAVLFDLAIGNPKTRPGPEMGLAACLDADSGGPFRRGNVGAGAGATVGKALGMGQAMKSGLGSASVELPNGLIVAALAAVNAFGDVIDPDIGKIIAGARAFGADGPDGPFIDTLEALKMMASGGMSFDAPPASGSNTVIGVVATNARLTKEGANKIAQMAQDGLARTIRPAHTMLDGDTIFALATGAVTADTTIVGAFAAQVFAAAVLDAVRSAASAGGLPGLG
jgi:L-aminopeptidase/D-esterase-like protein